jgi:8-oxo-dGTP pyrophosphatase MutT (NUDIX family)
MHAREQILKDYLGKLVHVEVDRPIGYLHGDIVYPVNYGYIPGTMAPDGEAQDVYILGVDVPIEEFDGQVIGAIRRKNDVEDKLVVAPVGQFYHQGQIAEAVHFQEQYFETRILSCLEKSCGVLPYRTIHGGREFLLVWEHFSQCWSLPKGHMEMDETEQQTALRELLEETGLTAKLDSSKKASIEYPISDVARKQVVFFLGQVSGEISLREGEIDNFRWVTADQLQDFLFPDTVQACRSLLD